MTATEIDPRFWRILAADGVGAIRGIMFSGGIGALAGAMIGALMSSSYAGIRIAIQAANEN
jgi:hypothetical protein